jgi:hypothetical protein
VPAFSGTIFAINDLGFIWVQFKSAKVKALSYFRKNLFSITLCSAMNQTIISIAALRTFTVVSLHPMIKSIMQKIGYSITGLLRRLEVHQTV